MSTLRELRIYVAKPDRLEELVDRWENHYSEIFEDHMTVLGYYVSHPENKDMPTGVALLLEHEDRAHVDRTFAAAKADPRMEKAAGPTGSSLVEDWERIFLYPLDFSSKHTSEE